MSAITITHQCCCCGKVLGNEANQHLWRVVTYRVCSFGGGCPAQTVTLAACLFCDWEKRSCFLDVSGNISARESSWNDCILCQIGMSIAQPSWALGSESRQWRPSRGRGLRRHASCNSVSGRATVSGILAEPPRQDLQKVRTGEWATTTCWTNSSGPT